ncbi:MAG: DNA methyltransferase [Candidatus Tenebribacter burtonii]|jgi:site-specific DNA-methyltransferase (adenine-specific)|nr:DNA methyltransferase [Candidatus Tenebribacter burtonii]
MNKLYFGDNLEIMKELLKQNPNGFIDLIYIDPPFNSKRNYNVLYESIDMEDTKAQKQAFADTWSNVSYLDTLREIQDINMDLYEFINALDKINISKSAISYLATMGIRIWHMHKLLKKTGSFYLHCDPTMSHYLKITCDLIFGESNFKNEITWQRTNAHSDSKSYASTNDIIMFYVKSKSYIFNLQHRPYSENYIKKYYKHFDKNKRQFLDRDLTAGGLSGGGYEYTWKGVTKTWRCPQTTMEKYQAENRIYYTSKGTPRLKQFLDEMPGVPINNNWIDISPINS